MKGKIEPVPTFKITAIGYDPITQTEIPQTKTVRKAKPAAEFYAITRSYNWWHRKGHLYTGPDRHERYSDRSAKLYRRVLKVFNQYLP